MAGPGVSGLDDKAGEDEPLPSFKADVSGALSDEQRGVSARALSAADEGVKGDPGDAQRSGQHCSHGSHG